MEEKILENLSCKRKDQIRKNDKKISFLKKPHLVKKNQSRIKHIAMFKYRDNKHSLRDFKQEDTYNLEPENKKHDGSLKNEFEEWVFITSENSNATDKIKKKTLLNHIMSYFYT